MSDYVIEAGGTLTEYTTEQLGSPIRGTLINSKSRDRYDLIVKDTNQQVVVLSACSWFMCQRRVREMLKAGVDYADIFGVSRSGVAGQFMPDHLYPAQRFLWGWTTT